MRTDELGNTYTVFGRKVYKRFEVKEDDEPLNEDMAYMIFDNETMMVISYISEDELDIGLDVVKYLNGLSNECKYYENELNSLQEYMGVSKSELVEANKALESRRRYEEGLHKLEIQHAKEVLKTCIAQYPESKGLLDFKASMEW